MLVVLDKIMWLTGKARVFVIRYHVMKMCTDAQNRSSAFTASGLDGAFKSQIKNDKKVNVITGFQEY